MKYAQSEKLIDLTTLIKGQLSNKYTNNINPPIILYIHRYWKRKRFISGVERNVKEERYGLAQCVMETLQYHDEKQQSSHS